MPQRGTIRQLPAPRQPAPNAIWPVGTSMQCASRMGDLAGTNYLTAAANQLFAAPLDIPFDVTVDAIGVNLGQAHSSSTFTFRLGLALNDNTNGSPGTIIVDAGTIVVAAGAAAGIRTAVIQPTLLRADLSYSVLYSGDLALSGSGPFFRGPLSAPRTSGTPVGTALGPYRLASWTGPTAPFVGRLAPSTVDVGNIVQGAFLRRWV